jgi:hypothetical protein
MKTMRSASGTDAGAPRFGLPAIELLDVGAEMRALPEFGVDQLAQLVLEVCPAAPGDGAHVLWG